MKRNNLSNFEGSGSISLLMFDINVSDIVPCKSSGLVQLGCWMGGLEHSS